MFELRPYTGKNETAYFDPFDAMERIWFSPEREKKSIAMFGTDVREEDDAYILTSDLPGVNKDDIDVSINGNTLTLKAERKSQSEEKKGKYIHSERSFGVYTRTFDITGIDADNIKAKYADGVLTMTLPKKMPELPSQKKLQIE